jgi:3-phenylpropionate/trans-cinnamate dioxygenase ferredoxin subunit
MSDSVRVPLGDLGDLGEGELRSYPAGAFQVMVCRVAGTLYALEDECSHAETSLSDGMLEGYAVTCPLHFAQFDVRDGRHLCPPAYTGVRTFTLVEDAEGATVEVPTEKRPAVDPGVPGGMFRTR